MLINHEREKLIQAINFFARNTRYFGKIKLCKLLYFLDFEHFAMTGRSVTGLSYNAWKMGPVPVAVYEEIDNPREDMAAVLKFGERALGTEGKKMLTVKTLAEFDASLFSKRELKLMEKLAVEFKFTRADDMVEATHLENLPWHKVWNEEGARQASIPYELAIRKDEYEEMLRVAEERKAIVGHFG